MHYDYTITIHVKKINVPSRIKRIGKFRGGIPLENEYTYAKLHSQLIFLYLPP